jgi:hypothetical protein
MLKSLKFWTLIIALIGAFGGVPYLWNLIFVKSEIQGKIISRYDNINPNEQSTMFLFKLSFFAKNKPYNIKQISCQIQDIEGKKFDAIAFNSRLTVFTNKVIDGLSPSGKPNFIEKQQRLLVSEDKFLNNYSFFPAEKNVTGYLLFKFGEILDKELESTTFVFESFNGRIKKITFKEAKIKDFSLFYDDTIWENYTE